MFDIKEFFQTITILAPFTMGLVMALVTLWGKFGVSGKWQLLSSLLTGVVTGVLFYYFTNTPESAVEWFSAGLFGLIIGLTASGVYDAVKEAAGK